MLLPDYAARRRDPQSAVHNPRHRSRALLLRAWRLSHSDRRLALEATAWLTLASAAVRGLPRRWLGRLLQRVPPLRERRDVNDEALHMVERVARVHPLRPLCLEQAIAGRWMLARRGRRSTLVIGARLPHFEAHAWLEVEGHSAASAGYDRIWNDESGSGHVGQGFSPAADCGLRIADRGLRIADRGR